MSTRPDLGEEEMKCTVLEKEDVSIFRNISWAGQGSSGQFAVNL